ncbi:MAG: CocE/NonD family hydrolase [Bacteroidota bacterium]|nr:CocE/NonD family hydrolase [Bacteroidota bacterium]
MKLLLWAIVLIIPILSQGQEPDPNWIRKNYSKIELYIPMRDGVRLFTSVYIPKDTTEKHPILITRTPYSCAPYGEDAFHTLPPSHYKEYYQGNYIIVGQDVRGRYLSEGTFSDVRPFIAEKKSNTETDEASDTYDTVDWLVKNIANNNGRVGIIGISYPGFYATMGALSNHPAIKAVSPQAPVCDWFIGDDFHHNGAFLMMDAFGFFSGFGKPRPTPTKSGREGFNKYPTRDSYEFYLRIGCLSNLLKLMGDSVTFWNNIYNHPNYDAWWEARNPTHFMNKIPSSVATLVVGGLFDSEDYYGALNTYKAIETKAKNNNKLIIGPWYHGQWGTTDGSRLGNVQFGSNTSAWYGHNLEVPFFNYYLKGKGSLDSLAEATVFFTGENQWHHLDKWPPAEMKSRALYLQENGKLSFHETKRKVQFAQYVSDPTKPVPFMEKVSFGKTNEFMTDDQRFAARRTDVLVFQTDTLKEDLTIAGPLTADLKVAISGTDADFVVKLIDVFPDYFEYPQKTGANAPVYTASTTLMNGYQMLVRGDVMRGKYRNSMEHPEPFIPNKPTVVKFSMNDIAHTFQKGHRIMIQIQSSWFPLVDRNPQKFTDIYHAKESDFQKADIKIYLNDSKIILPVVPKSQ